MLHLSYALWKEGLMHQGKSIDKPINSLLLNPLPHMPILGYSNSAANKDLMSNISTNGETII